MLIKVQRDRADASVAAFALQGPPPGPAIALAGKMITEAGSHRGVVEHCRADVTKQCLRGTSCRHKALPAICLSEAPEFDCFVW